MATRAAPHCAVHTPSNHKSSPLLNMPIQASPCTICVELPSLVRLLSTSVRLVSTSSQTIRPHDPLGNPFARPISPCHCPASSQSSCRVHALGISRTYPKATNGAVCSPASHTPRSGIPFLMTSMSSLPCSSPLWKLQYEPYPANSSFAQAVARIACGSCCGLVAE